MGTPVSSDCKNKGHVWCSLQSLTTGWRSLGMQLVQVVKIIAPHQTRLHHSHKCKTCWRQAANHGVFLASQLDKKAY
eukprot:6172747-Pleurochrysis_carterae.AAC.8